MVENKISNLPILNHQPDKHMKDSKLANLTKEQLQHLAKLASIKIDSVEQEKLLPQLEKIITFVEKLDNCDLEGFSHATKGNIIHCNE